jgi:hypothetical protein
MHISRPLALAMSSLALSAASVLPLGGAVTQANAATTIPQGRHTLQQTPAPGTDDEGDGDGTDNSTDGDSTDNSTDNSPDNGTDNIDSSSE